MFDRFDVDGGMPLTNADLVNQTFSPYDMYAVCALLANMSAVAAAAAAATATAVWQSPTSQSPQSFDAIPYEDKRPLFPCHIIPSFTKCLYDISADQSRSGRRLDNMMTDDPSSTADFIEATTEQPFDEVVEQILEENIGAFSQMADVAKLSLAAAGVLANFVAIISVIGDIQTPRSWRFIYCGFVGIDQLLLVVSIIMLTINVVRPWRPGRYDSVADPSAVAMSSWWLERLVALNALGSVLAAVQLIQPWFLHTVSCHVYRCLVAERLDRRRRHCRRSTDFDERSLPPLPSFPVGRLIMTVAFGIAFFVVLLPPVRVQLFLNVPWHTTLCNVPIVDHWNLIVDRSSSGDPFYLAFHCLLYVLAVYLVPVFPLMHRSKRIIDELSKRPDDIPTASGLATLCRWSTVVSATCNLHLIGSSTKTVLVAMRLVDCACALPLGFTTTATMQRCDVTFRYLNGLANFGQLIVRPCCHLPVRLANDWRLRTTVARLGYSLRRIALDGIKKCRQGRPPVAMLTVRIQRSCCGGGSTAVDGVRAGKVVIELTESAVDPSAIAGSSAAAVHL